MLLATENFVDWTSVGTFTPSGSWFEFVDTDAAVYGSRFFRPVMVEYLFDSLRLSLTNQQALVRVNGAQTNHTLVLQGSEDLRHWNALGSTTPAVLTNWLFLDTNAPNFPKRFYRMVGQGR